jgi:hypothetical protein
VDGKPVANSTDMNNFGRVAKIFIDPKANEGYIADGYFNHRVAVIDLDNGKIKRMWGAYGEPPTDLALGPYDPTQPPAKQFRTPVHCAEMSNDGFVYVCDRPNDRLQIFTREGKFVKEVFVAKQTRADGSVWDVAFSKDPQQTWLYMADGVNEHVRVFNRATMEEVYNFGYASRACSSACTASPSTRRATSTRPKPTRASACSGSTSRGWARCRRAACPRGPRPAACNEPPARSSRLQRSRPGEHPCRLFVFRPPLPSAVWGNISRPTP